MKIYKVIRYIFSGGVATASNVLLLFICVHYFKIWYLTSAIISYCFGIIVSYLLQKFFAFKDRSKKDIHKQFALFFIYMTIMLGFNTLLMYIFVSVLGLWYLLSQALASIIIAFVNFTVMNRIIFVNKPAVEKGVDL